METFLTYVALFQPFTIKCIVYILLVAILCRLSLNNIRRREITLLFIFVLWTLIIQTAEAAVQRMLKLQCLTGSGRAHDVHARNLKISSRLRSKTKQEKCEAKIIILRFDILCQWVWVLWNIRDLLTVRYSM